MDDREGPFLFFSYEMLELKQLLKNLVDKFRKLITFKTSNDSSRFGVRWFIWRVNITAVIVFRFLQFPNYNRRRRGVICRRGICRLNVNSCFRIAWREQI